MRMAKDFDEYISFYPDREKELVLLRDLILGCGLTQTIKWGVPVFTLNKKNIVGIAAFKTYVGLWFYQGSFLKDEAKVLINAQEGVTKGLRQWRFNTMKDIPIDLVKDYVFEAIENQKMGLEIKPEKKKLVIPDELQNALNKNPELTHQYQQLSPFKQREYAEYIGEAKREATRMKRLDKCVPMILEGIGLNDRYR